MAKKDPTVKDYFEESDRHDASDAEKIPEDIRTQANQILADNS